MREELNHIFQWALKGLERLVTNDFKFTENKATIQAIEDYKLNSNSTLMFINECCVLSKDDYIASTELYSEYKEFCNQDGFSPVSSIRFFGELETSFNGEVDYLPYSIGECYGRQLTRENELFIQKIDDSNTWTVYRMKHSETDSRHSTEKIVIETNSFQAAIERANTYIYNFLSFIDKEVKKSNK